MTDDASGSSALPQAFQSDHTLVQSLLASDKTLAEIYVCFLTYILMHLIYCSKKTIRLWLEEIAPPSHPAPKRSGYLAQTAKKIKDTQRSLKSGAGLEKGDYVSQLDPDAVSRQGKSLAPEDVV
jgi:hypothetical protein